MGNSDSRTVFDSSSCTTYYINRMSADEIQKLMINLNGQLSIEVRRLFQEARAKITEAGAMDNGKITIYTCDHVYFIIAGSGSNEFVIQEDGRDNILFTWTKKSFTMTLKSGYNQFLKFLKKGAKFVAGAIGHASQLAIAYI